MQNSQSRYPNYFCLSAFFLIVLIAAGCATNPISYSVQPFILTGYGNIEAIKASRFKIVDDFTSKNNLNMVGGRWQLLGGAEVTLEALFYEEDVVLPYGQSLGFNIEAKRNKEAVWYTELNHLDISAAEGISFWIKGDENVEKSIFVEIEDSKGRKKRCDVKATLRKNGKGWKEVFIPRKRLRGVDFNDLKGLKIIFKAGSKDLKGSLLIDRLCFFGEEELYFLSLKDNLLGFPQKVLVTKIEQEKLLKKEDEKLLNEIARASWKYFENLVDSRSHLPVDHVKLDWKREIGDYTSPTSIGLYYLACIAASDLGLISEGEAYKRISKSLHTLEKLARWQGLFYNYYNTTNLQATSEFVSTVDNGWLAAAFLVVRNAFSHKLSKRVDRIFEEMDFATLYDLGEGKFTLGFDVAKRTLSEYHYGLLCTEPRVTSLVAIAKGDIEPEHWFLMHRTLPSDWKWQRQEPEGSFREYLGINVFEGYYTYNGKKIVPSWGGALFEFLMPTLVVKEQELAQQGLGLNNILATEIQIDYALRKKDYPAWGISSCAIDSGRGGGYGEYGVKDIGSKGYPEEAIITPHVSFLALNIRPKEAIANIRKILELFDIYGEYGFYDSVNLKNRKVTRQYLALDQGMSLVAIANYLKGGAIKNRFHENKIIKDKEFLLSVEKFF